MEVQVRVTEILEPQSFLGKDGVTTYTRYSFLGTTFGDFPRVIYFQTLGQDKFSQMNIQVGGIYTRFFEDCVSLRSVYANLSPSDRVEYTLTDWLKGTHAGDRTIYVPDTLDVNYDLYLPESWTREVYEF